MPHNLSSFHRLNPATPITAFHCTHASSGMGNWQGGKVPHRPVVTSFSPEINSETTTFRSVIIFHPFVVASVAESVGLDLDGVGARYKFRMPRNSFTHSGKAIRRWMELWVIKETIHHEAYVFDCFPRSDPQVWRTTRADLRVFFLNPFNAQRPRKNKFPVTIPPKIRY